MKLDNKGKDINSAENIRRDVAKIIDECTFPIRYMPEWHAIQDIERYGRYSEAKRIYRR
ncbi:hypothetical protein ECA0952 [Pectobacterium atrosepticum SCRI1043]|uniref:Uncharacterized protein n=1 Tax=Pectobacterium atrosepticum (strain SCRI 1043 / ATCC BAA-672) TaxID=218491 RepID=Q6D8M0_PECAS|nr:hypothetical protein ECA0952 [Pectobacterium atrosepticum SCRI1043]